VSGDAVLYAHARDPAPGIESGKCARTGERHGNLELWLNPPPIPLGSVDMDAIYELPYARRPHPAYGTPKIPAYNMIRFSVAIQRGCSADVRFSITNMRPIIQSRSEDSVIREIEPFATKVAGSRA